MSRTYMEFLNDRERNAIINSNQFDIESEKIHFVLEMCERRISLQIEEAELKVLTESGTYDDLEYFYDIILTEADNQKRKMSIGERIRNLIDLVIKGIKGLFDGNASKIPNGTKVKIDKQTLRELGFIGSIKKFISMIKDTITNGAEKLVDIVKNSNLGTIAVAGGGAAVAAGIAGSIMNKKNMDDIKESLNIAKANHDKDKAAGNDDSEEVEVSDLKHNSDECDKLLQEMISLLDKMDELEADVYNQTVDYNNKVRDISSDMKTTKDMIDNNRAIQYLASDDPNTVDQLKEEEKNLQNQLSNKKAELKKLLITAPDKDPNVKKKQEEIERIQERVAEIQKTVKNEKGVRLITTTTYTKGRNKENIKQDTKVTPKVDKKGIMKSLNTVYGWLMGFVKFIRSLIDKLHRKIENISPATI